MTTLYALVFLILGGLSVSGWLILIDAPALRPVSRVLGTAALAFFILATMAAYQAARGHDIYHRWTPPGNPNTSCCNDSDCRPTRAYVDDAGQWQAWNGLRWLPVPAERVLPTDFAGDGRSHICEKEGFIYCFSPGPPRS